MEQFEPLNKVCAERQIVTGMIGDVYLRSFMNRLPPVLYSSFFFCSWNCVVQNKPKESTNEHVGGEENHYELIQFFYACVDRAWVRVKPGWEHKTTEG